MTAQATDPMAGIVWSPIGHIEPDTLIVLDAERRAYAALSRDGLLFHLIQPARREDPRVGDGLRVAGQLVCTCQAGTFRGVCYQIERAEAFEGARPAGRRDPEVAWLAPAMGLDNPAGAGDAVEASRG